MERRLSELFKAARGATVQWQGRTVHMAYDVAGLTVSSTVRVRFLTASKDPPQALRVKARGGRFEVNGTLSDDLLLWADTAPQVVEMHALPTSRRRPMTARLWNAWRDPFGTTQAWIGDAGILVEEPSTGVVILRCSDGYGAPSFDDLVVELGIGKR